MKTLQWSVFLLITVVFELVAIAVRSPSGAVAVQASGPTQSDDLRYRIESVAGIPFERARAVFHAIKVAVEKGDKQGLARLVIYPISVNIDKDRRRRIDNQAEFIKLYDKVVTTKVKRAVASQSFDTLFVNWQGIMIGDGELWFGGVCLPKSPPKKCVGMQVGIIAVNGY